MPTPTQQSSTFKSPVEFVRFEVQDMLPRWQVIRAAIHGEHEIKALKDRILPRPNAADLSAQNQARYEAYLQRAVWYNASGWTLTGMTGFVFLKEPVAKLPAELKALETNVDGSGVTLNQQAQEALRFVLAYGRAGLLVDYPTTPEGEATTRQQLLDGHVQPTIILYTPEQMVNWKITTVGSKIILSLLVLKETAMAEEEADEFALITRIQYRVLCLEDGEVYGRIFRQADNADTYEHDPDMDYFPTDAAGKPLTTIPFTFLGSVNNDSRIDPPPLQDLVNLNVAHFRNSADYEEACFLVGQPTPWVSGLTQSWVTDVLGGTVQLGSRAILPLPVGGAAGLIQAAENTMPMEAMKHKEEQMVAIGAKLVLAPEVQKTATEASLEATAEVSTLTAAATNVFLGYKVALGFAGVYVGADTTGVDYELSEPLTQDTLDAQQATALLSLWQGGLCDFEEARWTLKKCGLAWKDDAKVKAMMENGGLPPGPAGFDPNNPGAVGKKPGLPAPAPRAALPAPAGK